VVVEAIRNGQLYAITHPMQADRVETRAARLLAAFGKRITVTEAGPG